jgi:FtsP/CotA-like multicopper oxidase with cupredoxin domain
MKHRLFATLALAALAFAVVVTAAAGGGRGQLFQFRGDVVAASSTSVQISINGGNHAALKALIGQSQTESFTLDGNSKILVVQNGVPHVGSAADLKAGDNVTVNVRARAGSSLADLLGTAAATVSDRGTAHATGGKPLFLYVGTVAGGQAGGHIALHVTSGNWRGLKTMLGQANLDQTFSYDTGTIFLLWQGRVPTVIDPSQLKAGDRITVRVRAPRGSTLAQVEATPATHVGDHEPGQVEDKTS